MLSSQVAPQGSSPWSWLRRERAAGVSRHVYRYEHILGTSFELQVWSASARSARRAEEGVLAEVDRLTPIFNGWSGTSELSRWGSSYNEDVPISEELAELLRMSEEWRERTGGAFDPLAGSVIALLCDGEPNDSDSMRSLRAHMRGARWRLDAARGTARRLTNLRISLDAIAKGYIVARAAASAKRIAGVESMLLNIGGDIQHLGATGVKVGVASPFAPEENAAPATAIMLENAAIATSGGYRRSFTVSGKRLSHLVDPRSGEAVSRIASASVIAPDCATADALSTAFSVMTPSESVQLADSLPDVGCYLIERDGTIWASSRWQKATVPAVPYE